MRISEQNRRKLKVTKAIVTDEYNTPMTFDGKQFIYSEREKRIKLPIEVYNENEAKELIKKSAAFRSIKGYHNINYRLMPVNIA